jgi:hypothetical protein
MHLNLLGKITLAACGAWLIGKTTNVKLRGTPEQIDAVSRALVSSKRFQEELVRPGATVEEVIERMNVKNMDAKQFEQIFGVKWPL